MQTITLTDGKRNTWRLSARKDFYVQILWRYKFRAAAGKFGGNLAVLSNFLGIGFAYIGKKQYLCSNPKWRDNNYYVK